MMQAVAEWIWNTGLAQLWSFIVVALLVYAGGAASKLIAKKMKWKGTEENPSWYDIWQRVAPFPAGALLGVIPFPTLRVIEDIADGAWSGQEVSARMGWFMLAGAVCGQVYELGAFAYSTAKKRIAALAEAKEKT